MDAHAKNTATLETPAKQPIKTEPAKETTPAVTPSKELVETFNSVKLELQTGIVSFQVETRGKLAFLGRQVFKLVRIGAAEGKTKINTESTAKQICDFVAEHVPHCDKNFVAKCLSTARAAKLATDIKVYEQWAAAGSNEEANSIIGKAVIIKTRKTELELAVAKYRKLDSAEQEIFRNTLGLTKKL